MISMGENIRRARKKMGFTQEELAIQIGVTAPAVSRWESGAGLPDISMIVPLAQVLNISTDALFGIERVNQDDVQYMEIKKVFEEIESKATTPVEGALNECKLMLEKCRISPANYVYGCCLVERTANLSRYVDYENFAKEEWEEIRKQAIRSGMSVLRFCTSKEWLERTHYAMAWIYIHEKEYSNAREHIDTLPSVSNNRLRESILAQITSFEQGVEGMKKVVRENLQNFTRAINKEILYAMQDLSWEDTPEEAIAFGQWGLSVMDALSTQKEMLPYCRGFFRDIYMYIIHCDLRLEDYESAAKHYKELQQGMQYHYAYYQQVFEDPMRLTKFSERQLNNMRAYTKEYIQDKQKKILERLKDWHADKVNRFLELN